jgi:hypothetical protein
MSVMEERAEFFAQWRSGIKDENYKLCEDNMNFLLTSLDDHSRSWSFLSNNYNNSLSAMIQELGEIKNLYNQDKRLSKGFAAETMQMDRCHRFWIELYDLFYKEFRKNSLVSVTK